MDGINGKILKIHLGNKSYEIEDKDENFYRKYIGGRGIALYYMHKEISDNIDAFSPKNLLIFAAGLLTGVPGPAIPRYTVCAKSPLTDGFGESEAGGYWGPELKRAGFDAIIIKGKAEKPLYLFVKDGKVEFKEAKNIWGKETGEVEDIIKEELGDNKIKIAQIGPGGENMVRYANITNELRHYNGRTGLGGVMGSKNLKAIAVRGTKKLKLANRDKVVEIARWAAKEGMENPLADLLHKIGTPATVMGNNEAGALPTRNWQKGYYEDAEKISGETMQETIGQSPEGCFACPVRCKRKVKVEEKDIKVDPRYGGPEYETIAAMGSLLEINDLRIIAKANELCNRYTIDTISTGMTIAFAMECYEKGLLTKEETDGLELKFGNSKVVLSLIKKIAKRKGIGDLLAEGSLRAAKELGGQAKRYVYQVKGQELPMHDPRVKTGVGLQYALADYGADHMK
ncbi:MAG TPA: aldehyde ferredoxin oxidoreductase family protein, partial [Halanaerobiales bacterium]|nr:aldehyde ferredoxin oxidoreductase family protein [Halanaerobiales bacterium]